MEIMLCLAIPRLVHKEILVCVHKETNFKMSIKALFEKGRNWKQFKCLSTGKLINCYTHAMEYNRAVKMNELELLVSI